MSSSKLLENRDFDVAPTCQKILCCGSLTLHLDAEEAVLKNSTCIGASEKRLPYGELGSVEQVSQCGCCHGFRSNLSGADENGKKTVMVPGCGCEGALVDDIIAELKARMKGRGDTGNIQRSEEAIMRQQHLNGKVELILKQMGIGAPPKLVKPNAMEHNIETFPHIDYDVTPCIAKICCGKTLLNLESEEVQLISTTPCSKDVKRFPYGQLGDVASGKACGCCVGVQSTQLGNVSPGCGCNEDLVQKIAAELKKRMKARGDTGNIQRQEFANKLSRDQDAMVDAILQHLRIPLPPVPEGLQQKPVSQQMR